MAEIHTSTKKNRLTLYIIIGLILGITVGFWMNSSYVWEENKTIADSEAAIAAIQDKIAAITDTTNAAYGPLMAEKTSLIAAKSEAVVARDSKLDVFSLMADIFLRLIKMIVAPLVFTTLVVGVARLGDMKAVGRIC